VGERFRLIYLKSIEPEKSTLDESSSSHAPQETSRETFTIEYNAPETLSTQIILSQAKADLKHPAPKVRMLAIQYLEKSDASIAIPLLQEMLSDRDPGVRVKAISSLVKFRNPTLCPLLKKYVRDSDPMVRIAALRGMLQLGEAIDMNILLQFLSDGSSWVRRKVATLLGWTQMEGVFPVLIEMSRDPDPKVRKAALFSLVTLYPEESENRLVEAMTDTDPNLRHWARGALEKMMERPFKVRMGPLANRS